MYISHARIRSFIFLGLYSGQERWSINQENKHLLSVSSIRRGHEAVWRGIRITPPVYVNCFELIFRDDTQLIGTEANSGTAQLMTEGLLNSNAGNSYYICTKVVLKKIKSQHT